tara:strand:+ start:2361 stop:2483 length:123 start_codon:yes stop_codon:yes gene_type:complete
VQPAEKRVVNVSSGQYFPMAAADIMEAYPQVLKLPMEESE